MPHEDDQQRGPRRRAVVRGAAWSVPVVSLTLAAPAFAVSPVICPPMPTGASWTTTKSLNTNAAPSSWTGTTFTMNTDNSLGTIGALRGTVVTRVGIPVTSGTTYNLGFTIATANGFNLRAFTIDTDAVISIGGTYSAVTNSIVGGTTLFSGYTKAGGTGTTLVAPPAYPTSGFGTNQLFTAGYTASATASVLLAFSFSMPPSQGDNDDWRITPAFTTCTVN